MNSDNVSKLKAGQTVRFRPRGNSMRGKIESGQLVTIVPVDQQELKVGDVVFCRVKGRFYVHLVSAIQEGRYQISNNKGLVNGWIGKDSLFGKVVRVEN